MILTHKQNDMHTKKIKVLMVNTVPMEYNGISISLLKYAANIDRCDLEMDFVVINRLEPGMRLQIESMGSKVYELTNRNTAPWKYVLSLRNVVRRGGYDVVHIHCNSCTAAIDLLGAKLGGAKLLCPHSHNTQCEHHIMHRLLRPLFNWLYTDAFACGTAAGKWLFGDRRFTVWNNALDMATYSFRQEERNRMRKVLELDGKIAIGHVGIFNRQKNHAFLLDVFTEIVKRDGRFVLFLIGDGPLQKEMEAKARESGIGQSVVFVGTTPDIPQYLNAMDLMVLPSLYEGLPNVVMEWQANGLSCLVADTVTRDCGLTDSVTFLPLDIQVWKERILSLKPGTDRQSRSRENCDKMTAAGFSIKEEAARLKAHYVKRLRKKVLAVASSGGHWIELLRITKSLEDTFDTIYVSTRPDRELSVNKRRFRLISDFSRTDAIKIIIVFIQAIRIIRSEKPDVIITTGAAPGLVMVFTGWLFRKRTIWIDSLANVEHLSLSGRIASRFVSRIYTQWEGLQDGKKVVFAGNVLE